MRVISPTFTVLDARQMMPKIFAVIKSIMSGHITLPRNENLHAGYEYDFSHDSTKDHTHILSQYPSDNKIRDLLEVAESLAEELAAFAGMATNNPDVSVQEPTGEQTLEEQHADVSISIHKRSYLEYPFNSATVTPEEALETAAGLTSQHQEADVVMSKLTSELEDLAFGASFTSMVQQPDPNQLPNKSAKSTTISEASLTPDGILNIVDMASKRHAHDSQVQKHHGPERPRTTSKDLSVPQYDPDTGSEILSPSQYSKAVSFYWRSHEDPEYGESRQNHWKTLGKRKLHKDTDDPPEKNLEALDAPGTQIERISGADCTEPKKTTKWLG
ncbi:uncharacterized protein MELLADRAFT_88050 [Melampsora larici-populina 98AG31]|uniref:Uncharacterized protein n=1 Tax=Melampsora larici-populina (strain 98AG31 / pathotype 3-4-7) TaxID=747676 RepID=F4RQ91_MELLP|nr:uncharacterized protein MELLADRAFT_88050 [Melampsora larici-populina 98AG31]EGG05445.1 hypothetical protein MELLADRAFT_88050 [Melampsora larici-populina 98AG31]